MKNKHGTILANSSLFLLYNPMSYKFPIYKITKFIKIIVTDFERIDFIAGKMGKFPGEYME
jgi:hypothetical protein